MSGQVTSVPLGPLPNLDGLTSTLIAAGNAASLFPVIAPLPPGVASPDGTSSTLTGAGNASALFPEITPAPAPSPAPRAPSPAAARSVAPAERVATASTTLLGTSVLTAQALGLIALALAIMLTVSGLFRRGRTKARGPGALFAGPVAGRGASLLLVRRSAGRPGAAAMTGGSSPRRSEKSGEMSERWARERVTLLIVDRKRVLKS